MTWSSKDGDGLVLRFRRALHLQVRPEDAQAHRISDQGAQAGFPVGNLDLEVDQEGHVLVRHHVPGVARQPRSEDRRDQVLSAGRGIQRLQGADELRRAAPRRRRQGVDQERRHRRRLPRRSRDPEMGALPAAQGTVQRQAQHDLPGHLRLEEQSLDGRVRERLPRQDRRQDPEGHLVSGADAERARAPHADRRPGPHLGDRISRQQGRDVRPEDGEVHRVSAAAVHLPVPLHRRQERRDLDRRHAAPTASCATTRRPARRIEYPMPDETNIRSVCVDNSTSPATFWTGSNHGAALVKVEPLD